MNTRVFGRLRCAPKSPCTWWQESGWVSQWSATPSPELSATRSVTRGERPTWSVHTKQYQRLCFPCPASPSPELSATRKQSPEGRGPHGAYKKTISDDRGGQSDSGQGSGPVVLRLLGLDEGAEGGCGDAVVEAEGCGGWVDYQSRSEGVAEPVSQRGEVAGIGGLHGF